MRTFGEKQHRLFQGESAKSKDDFSQFKERPFTSEFKLYQVDGDGYAGQMDSLRENGLIEISVLEPGIKKGQLLKVLNADVENEYALAVVIKVTPKKQTFTPGPLGQTISKINDNWGTFLQVVEETHEKVRQLTEDETASFEQHGVIIFPRGGNGIPLPEYVEHYRQHYYQHIGKYLERFFFTIRDANGFIRVAQASRVSATEVKFSRAD